MGRLDIDEWHWVTMMDREWWGAEPPETTRPLMLPVTWIRFTYEDIYADAKDIKGALQYAQRYHVKIATVPDIAYNFLVDTDGAIYEGRGWFNEANRPFCYYGLDSKCLDICYIGYYEDEDVQIPWEQEKSAWYLIMYGIKMNYISAEYRTIGLRDEYVPPY